MSLGCVRWLVRFTSARAAGGRGGFSLMIVAGVFMAFAVVGAVAIERTTVTQSLTRKDNTATQLSKLSSALLQYYVFNSNRFPCPAPTNVLPTTAGFGTAAASCNAGALPAGTVGLPANAAADTFIRGMVPVLDLAPYGVDVNDAFDNWGNRIMYVVDRGMTPSGTGASATKPTVTEWNLNTTVTPPNFILISYGADRLGGIPRSGTAVALACGAGGLRRDKNCNGGMAFLTGPYNVGSNVVAADYFDDVVSTYYASDGTVVAGGSAPVTPTPTGDVYCWGENTVGQVGNSGEAIDGLAHDPKPIIGMPSGVTLTRVSVGSYTGVGIGSDGNAYSWGNKNDMGIAMHCSANCPLLGNGTTNVGSTSPTLISALPAGAKFVRVETNAAVSCGLADNGKMYCWGDGTWSGLGNGSTARQASPVQVLTTNMTAGLSTWGLFSMMHGTYSSGHSCASAPDGQILCWGYNWKSQLGNAPATTASSTPIAALISFGGTNAPIQLKIGGSHTCVLTLDGLVYCWGYNANGQMGTTATGGAAGEGPTQTAIPAAAAPVRQIAAGNSHTCAIGANLVTYCWGRNSSYELAYQTSAVASLPTPTAITNLPAGVVMTKLAAGRFYTCGIGSNGRLYCWGGNDINQLANTTNVGTSTTIPTPLRALLPSGVKPRQVTADFNTTCVSTTPVYNAYCWGRNDYGTLGNSTNSGTSTISTTPLPVAYPTDTVNGYYVLRSGGSHTCAIADNGKLYCWGRNDKGQLGIGSTDTDAHNTPLLVDIANVTRVTDVQPGENHTCALVNTASATGLLYCWGDNTYGQLGLGTTGTTTGTPTAPTLPANVPGFDLLTAGTDHSCASGLNISTGVNQLYCWGRNDTGQLGRGTPGATNLPTIITPIVPAATYGATYFTQISAGDKHTCGIANDGYAHCWGSNLNGQLGNASNAGTTTYAITRRIVNNGTSSAPNNTPFAMSQVSASRSGHTCGVDAGGFVYCWGDPTYGQLGRAAGTTALKRSAAPIASPPASILFSSVSTGGTHSTCARGSDGKNYCWGRNINGQLGNATNSGTDTANTSPLVVGGGYANFYTSISSGTMSACALINAD